MPAVVAGTPDLVDPEAIAAQSHRMAELRERLACLCEQIAGVEDSLALTFREIAQSAPKQRAERLRKMALAAQDYAVTERARAREYSE